MVEDEIERAKAALRVKAHEKRAALSASARAEAAQAACTHFFDGIALAGDEVVAAYWGIRDEMDCQPILIRLMDGGQRVCLPVVTGDGKPLELRVWEDGAPLYPAGFGTLAPEDLAPRAEPDVIIMPLLGYDDRGTRLGYGGGYYDRTLATLARKPRLVGLAFTAQKLDHIPREAHDVPLDAVVTEAGVVHFGSGQ
jgi:5-formyltetrahydrofolate cyclo-ligase